MTSPGPWMTRPESDGVIIYNTTDEPLIARVYIGSMREANARLISAAPEMLALLTKLYNSAYLAGEDHHRAGDIIEKVTGVKP